MPSRTQLREAKERLVPNGAPTPTIRTRGIRSKQLPMIILPCAHRGESSIGSVQCPSCKGNVELKVFPCTIHGTCTVAKRVEGVTGCCNGCREYAPKNPSLTKVYGPVRKRHFLYYVLPVSGNGVWRKGVDQLRLRWDLFTGTKVVVVATGGPIRERVDRAERISGASRLLPLDTVESVKRYLPPGCIVLTVENDPVLWEITGWRAALDLLLASTNDQDAVFYAHAKGATRRPNSPCQGWASLLYRSNLDHYSLVARSLLSYPVTGSLLRVGHYFPPPHHNSGWHYAGNFWWARAGFLKEYGHYVKDMPTGHGSEAWLGTVLPISQAGSLFNTPRDCGFLYDPRSMRAATAHYESWLNQYPPEAYPVEEERHDSSDHGVSQSQQDGVQPELVGKEGA